MVDEAEIGRLLDIIEGRCPVQSTAPQQTAAVVNRERDGLAEPKPCAACWRRTWMKCTATNQSTPGRCGDVAAPAAGVSDDDGAPQVTSVLVVGYSSAPEGRAALSRAIDEARIRNSKLIVVHASGRGDCRSPGGARRHWHSARSSRASRAMEPAEELISAAETEGADFIIIGLRRRSPVGKLLLEAMRSGFFLTRRVRCLRSRPIRTPDQSAAFSI